MEGERQAGREYKAKRASQEEQAEQSGGRRGQVERRRQARGFERQAPEQLKQMREQAKRDKSRGTVKPLQHQNNDPENEK